MANKLNKNDRELLIFLAEYRLLTVSQIAALCARRQTRGTKPRGEAHESRTGKGTDTGSRQRSGTSRAMGVALGARRQLAAHERDPRTQHSQQ